MVVGGVEVVEGEGGEVGIGVGEGEEKEKMERLEYEGGGMRKLEMERCGVGGVGGVEGDKGRRVCMVIGKGVGKEGKRG